MKRAILSFLVINHVLWGAVAHGAKRSFVSRHPILTSVVTCGVAIWGLFELRDWLWTDTNEPSRLENMAPGETVFLDEGILNQSKTCTLKLPTFYDLRRATAKLYCDGNLAGKFVGAVPDSSDYKHSRNLENAWPQIYSRVYTLVTAKGYSLVGRDPSSEFWYIFVR